MNRRQLLARAAALAFLPAFVREAFGAEGYQAPDLAAAIDAARKAGRPLAIIVVDPEFAGVDAWSNLFTSASNRMMARLGQCDWVCARPGSVRDVLGRTEPAWVWIVSPETGFAAGPGVPDIPAWPERPDTSVLPAVIAALDRVLAEAPPCLGMTLDIARREREHAREVVEHRWDQTGLDSLSDVTKRLRKDWECVGPPPSSLHALDRELRRAQRTVRAEQSRRRVEMRRWAAARDAAMVKMLDPLIRSVAGPLPLEHSRLAKRAVRSLREHAPLGARWGVDPGCGFYFEAAPDMPAEASPILCGMGRLPKKATRFLDFLVYKDPRGTLD